MAMREVLAEAPEFWAAVQRVLDRPVSKSTIKSMLAGNPVFIHSRRGLYRLGDLA